MCVTLTQKSPGLCVCVCVCGYDCLAACNINHVLIPLLAFVAELTFYVSADSVVSSIYARAGSLTSSISISMLSPGSGMHTKRFTSTSWYEGREFQKYSWTDLLSYRQNSFETYSFYTPSLCWIIVIVMCSIAPCKSPLPPPPNRKETNKSLITNVIWCLIEAISNWLKSC